MASTSRARPAPPPRNSTKTAAQKPPAKGGGGQSVAARLATLEKKHSELVGLVDRMSALVARLVENEAVTANLPALEAQLRQQVRGVLNQNGIKTETTAVEHTA